MTAPATSRAASSPTRSTECVEVGNLGCRHCTGGLLDGGLRQKFYGSPHALQLQVVKLADRYGVLLFRLFKYITTTYRARSTRCGVS